MSFSNPIPIAVAIVPYKNKLIGVRRGTEPNKREIAFPGGYINPGETFLEALSRELLEETGINIATKSWNVFHLTGSIQPNHILVFGICKEISEVNFDFQSNETQEVLLIDSSTSLSLPFHDDVKNKYFSNLDKLSFSAQQDKNTPKRSIL